jgi:hypothetical protein
MLKEAEEKSKINVPISTEAILELWQKYSEKLTSTSTQIALKSTIVDLDGSIIKVITPTLYVKEVLLQEVKLMEEIRSHFHKNDLILNIEVDKNKFPEYEDVSAIKTKLTAKEIYQSMHDKNPAIVDFIRELDLKSSGD